VNGEADEKDGGGRVAAVCKEITSLTLLQLLALPSDHVSAVIVYWFVGERETEGEKIGGTL
jgi:hypothetical protein